MVIPLDQRPRSGPYSGLNARSAKRFLTQAFTEAGLPFAEEDALEIVLEATGLDRTGLMLYGTDFLAPETFDQIKDHMARRLAGEPVDHILGWRDFFGRKFIITKDVLSPRADTETLVRVALDGLSDKRDPYLLDLGTGSGAIGLTLLAELPQARLLATDISEAALDIARQNAVVLDVQDRATFLAGEWWAAVPETARFDAIVSNPPYIDDAAMAKLEPEVVHYDPALALHGGPNGLRDYDVILSRALRHLAPGGWLGLEIGYDQGASVSKRVQSAGFCDICLHTDLGGLDRVVSARKTD